MTSGTMQWSLLRARVVGALASVRHYFGRYEGLLPSSGQRSGLHRQLQPRAFGSEGESPHIRGARVAQGVLKLRATQQSRSEADSRAGRESPASAQLRPVPLHSLPLEV